MRIGKLYKNSIVACSNIVGENYSREYQARVKRELGAMFRNPVNPPAYLVAMEKEEALGFAGYIQSWMDYHVYQIFWVNVRPELQHKGIGTALVKASIKEIKKKSGRDTARLILLTTTSPSFYTRLGFKTLVQVKKSAKAKPNVMMALRL